MEERATKRKIYLATYSDNAVEIIRQNHIGIELDDLCISEMLDEERRRDTLSNMKREIRDSGVQRMEDVLVHGPFTEIVPASIDHRAVDLGMERLNEAYSVCRQLGVKKMIVHSGYLPPLYDKGWHLERSAEFWNRFMADKEEDFHLCIENVLEEEPMMMEKLSEKIGDPRISLCLDIGHGNWRNNGEYSLPEWIQILGKNLGHLHLHNNYGKSDAHNSILEGNLDIGEIMEAVYRFCSEEITMTVESRNGADSIEWLKNYRENIRGGIL